MVCQNRGLMQPSPQDHRSGLAEDEGNWKKAHITEGSIQKDAFV